MHPRIRRSLALVASAAMVGASLLTVDAALAPAPSLAAYPVPPTPAGLPAAIEAPQPYIGQSTCDPVAKPGVSAFRNLLLATYSDSGSYGIVRDCGAGGQSEHKEGRAFDWKMSAYNAQQKGEVSALLSWLLRTDANGNEFAMARRFGIMYVIWNKKIWKAYDADAGWQPYSGASNHTDHVHFSFGWNGAQKVTSYWDKTVAPTFFGPKGPPHVTPVRRISNIKVVRDNGSTTLRMHSGGAAVKLVQKELRVPNVDGDYGAQTASYVANFQIDQKLPVTQEFGPEEWKRLFPFPVDPFGKADPAVFALGNVVLRGWAIDADTQQPVTVSASLDGAEPVTTTATVPRDDVGTAYPEWGPARGFALSLPVGDGDHTVCLTAVNATDDQGSATPGKSTPLGCQEVSAQHSPIGKLDSVASRLGRVQVRGWALDPDSADPSQLSLTVDDQPIDTPLAAVSRSDVAALYPDLGADHGFTAAFALPEGDHKVCLVAQDVVSPGSQATVACKSVTVRHTADGGIDVLRRAPGGVLLTGWGVDPDLDVPVDVDVVANGAPVATLTTGGTRSNLPATYSPQGTDQGFRVLLDLPTGTQRVCAVVRNAPDTTGGDFALPCSTVTVTHDPVATWEPLRLLVGGKVRVSGDAYDPDVMTASTLTATVDGAAQPVLTANRASSAAATTWPGYGGNRRFELDLNLTRGVHKVCLLAPNAAQTPGLDRSLGCRTVRAHDAMGGVTSVALKGRVATLYGWALDPDRSTATKAVLQVDGRNGADVVASRTRDYLTSLVPGYGTAHGASLTRTLSPGRHTLCLVAKNLAGTPGVAMRVGCRTVTVR